MVACFVDKKASPSCFDPSAGDAFHQIGLVPERRATLGHFA
jgi:hypothetical protein